MPINAQWHDDEKTILLNHHTGFISWDDLQELMEQVEALLSESKNPVFIIADLREADMLPMGIVLRFPELRSYLNNPQMEGVVIVGMNYIIRAIFDMLLQFSPALRSRITTASTLEDAEAYIDHKRHNGNGNGNAA